jgi:DNA repair protein RecN (Recombination protein N)
MIKNLIIKNFIIVRDLNIEFGDGLQVLTGETGAGKSIIVGAINVIFGSKIYPGMLFDDTKPAFLEIVLDINNPDKHLKKLLEKYDVDESEGEIFFSKEINSKLHGKTFFNGRRITNTIVNEFREALIDFHSQKDQQRLLDKNYQLEVLDAFANNTKKREEFTDSYNKLENKINELEKLERDEKEKAEKIKLFEYQANEIESLNLKIGEDEKLQTELNLLKHSEEILNHATVIEQVIYENEKSVYDIINSFIMKLSNFEEDNDHIKNTVFSLRESLSNLDEAISEIRNVQNIISVDTAKQEEIEERLDQINILKSKYRLNTTELINYLKKISDEIISYTSYHDKIKKMKENIEFDIIELKNKADILTEKRKKAALKFEEEIKKNIKKLAMPEAEIQIKFDKVITKKNSNRTLEGLSLSGQDEVEIYFSANKGIKKQPLKYAASGGELSRFLLIIKKILSDKLEDKIIIFDEIDIGIGGKTSELLGEFIFNIGKFHQVICITHLAPISAFADKHFAINKISNSEHSEVEVKELNQQEKRREIARMLSGSKTDLALKYADEILNKKELSK